MLTPARRAANQRNLAKARAARVPKARHWRHGLACASVLASLAGAGERAGDFLRHLIAISEALEPRDAWEKKIVAGIGEALWRRFRGLRLAARWHTSQLVGLLSGLAPGNPAANREEDGETASHQTRRRALRARRIALGLLVRLGEIQKVFKALKRVNRRLLILTAALLRARTGDPVVSTPGAGPVRMAAVTALPPEKIGNAYAHRDKEKAEKQRRLPHLRDEDEPGPAGSGEAPRLRDWEARLVAALEPATEEELEALERLSEVLWVQISQLAREARLEATQLRAALRRARRLAGEEKLAAVAMAVEDATLGDEGMREVAERLRKQAEALLDQFLVRKHGVRQGLGWTKRVLARYDRWRWRREGVPEVDLDEGWFGWF